MKEIRRMGREELEAEVLELRALAATGKTIMAEAMERVIRLERHASRDGYLVEPLTLGWFCRQPACGVFNADEKEFLLECRCCRSDRPMVASPQREESA